MRSTVTAVSLTWLSPRWLVSKAAHSFSLADMLCDRPLQELTFKRPDSHQQSKWERSNVAWIKRIKSADFPYFSYCLWAPIRKPPNNQSVVPPSPKRPIWCCTVASACHAVQEGSNNRALQDDWIDMLKCSMIAFRLGCFIAVWWMLG